MNTASLEQIVEAVLYEGYILYPYRASSRKNSRERFTFGRVYPEAYSQAQNGAEPCVLQAECLLVRGADESPSLNVRLGFLHPMARKVGAPDKLDSSSKVRGERSMTQNMSHVGHVFGTWFEAVERRVETPPLNLESLVGSWQTFPFQLPESWREESVNEDETQTGVIVRQQAGIQGKLLVTAQQLDQRLFKITVRVCNQTSVPENDLNDPDAVLLRTMASAHLIINIRGAEFISLMDPGREYKQAAESCQNSGMWPVLTGDQAKPERDTLLCSPIILYDYPQIAPESAGPLFDGTEIDEILTLRIQTMTEDEKLEMRHVDEHARRLLERTERLSGEGMLKLHGLMRPAADPAAQAALDSAAQVEFDDFFGAATPLKGVSVRGIYLQAGDKVRIWPRARADVMDLALEGQTAIIEAVEQDAERKIHLAVVFENDPGKDLGLSRQPGHRFFYGIEEVEPIRTEAR